MREESTFEKADKIMPVQAWLNAMDSRMLSGFRQLRAGPDNAACRQGLIFVGRKGMEEKMSEKREKFAFQDSRALNNSNHDTSK